MHDIDGPDAHFTNEEAVQITDLDPIDSPQRKRAAYIAGVLRAGLTTPWIRYGLSGLLILILLGALALQWQRPAPTKPNVARMAAPSFLSATSAQGLVFIQSTFYTLAAYQVTTGRLRWRTSLPNAATLDTDGQTLYCYFATATGTLLEALNTTTGKVLWHDALPPALPTEGLIFSRGPTGPALFYNKHALYVQSATSLIYAIQASTGQILWTHQADNSMTVPEETFWVLNDVIEYISPKSITHLLDATTGQEILSLPPGGYGYGSTLPTVDGQIVYTLPPPGSPSIHAFHIPDGKLLWSYSLTNHTWAQTEADGIVYLGAAEGDTLIALRGSDGHQLWSYHASDGQPVINTLSIENGTAYLVQQDGTVVAIRPGDGFVLWHTRIKTLGNQISQTSSLLLDNGNLVLFDQQTFTALPIYVLNASNGHLLWSSSRPIANFSAFAGTLYSLGNNGQLDAWRESDGQHLWSYSAPVGTNIFWQLAYNQPSLLFLLDYTSTLRALRTSDGKLLWHYP